LYPDLGRPKQRSTVLVECGADAQHKARIIPHMSTIPSTPAPPVDVASPASTSKETNGGKRKSMKRRNALCCYLPQLNNDDSRKTSCESALRRCNQGAGNDDGGQMHFGTCAMLRSGAAAGQLLCGSCKRPTKEHQFEDHLHELRRLSGNCDGPAKAHPLGTRLPRAGAAKRQSGMHYGIKCHTLAATRSRLIRSSSTRRERRGAKR